MLEGKLVMALLDKGGLRNRLLYRVRRHAGITTIFRATDPILSSDIAHWKNKALKPEEVRTRENTVQASINSFPEELIQTLQNHQPFFPVPSKPTFVKNLTQKPNKTTKEFPITLPEMDSNGNETTPRSQNDEADDFTWRQLKTIYRLHQEKNSNENAVENLDQPKTHQVQKLDDPIKRVEFKEKKPQIKPPDTDKSTQQGERQKDDNREYDTHSTIGEKISLEEKDQVTLPHSQSVIVNHRIVSEEPESKSKLSNLENRKQQEDMGSESTSKHNENNKDEMEIEDFQSEESVNSGQAENIESGLAYQPVPLESAWPVQKQPVESNPVVYTDRDEISHPTINLSETNPTHSKDPDQADTNIVQNALKHIISTRPTKSSIELIPPRKPRPSSHDIKVNSTETIIPELYKPNRESSREVKAPKQIKSASDIENSQMMEDLTIDKAFPEENYSDIRHPPKLLTEIKRTEAYPKTPKNTNVIQKEDHQKQDKRNELPSEFGTQKLAGNLRSNLIPTDIGPLPADLWTLLNMNPPQGGIHKETNPEIKEEVSAKPVEISEDTTLFRKDSLKALSTPKSERITHESNHIQRAITGDETQTTSLQESISATSPEDETSQTTEPNIKELSKQVYREIRQRLMVEWERSRIRK